MDAKRLATEQNETLPPSGEGQLVHGRYRLVRHLGFGASKQVFVARDMRLERDVALAFVPGARPATSARERLEREVKLMARLGEHPNIVTVYDIADDHGVPYITARLMAGGTVADRLSASATGRFVVDEAVAIAAQVASGLAHVHAHGIVHRDIKPSNIWLDREGRAAIGDFGIALAPASPRITVPAAFIGTPAYSSPEQLMGHAVDSRSDLYSLGVVLYELLSGRLPFLAQSVVALGEEHRNRAPVPPSELNPAVPRWLDEFVLALLSESPSARPPSAHKVRAAMLAGFASPARFPDLPTTPDETLGREHDVRALADMLAADTTRLVTLTGVGGVGKTRLAVETARTVGHRYRDGCGFVDLAAITDPQHAPAVISRTLGAEPRRGESVRSALERRLCQLELLLILDNLEQLLPDAANLVADLSGKCRDVTFLVTSREPLHVRSERRYPVEPLTLPESPNATAVLRSSATALFVERAKAQEPRFRIGNSAPAILEVCTRLDGLPLAIELAAARVPLLSPQLIAERLDDALTTLGRGPREAPERQRTLRATLAWSVDLLTDSEREAFSAFAVFAGGAREVDAERVTSSGIDDLQALESKHLVTVRRRNTPRMRLAMLEMIRQFGLELMAERTDERELRRRHAQHYLDIADAARPHLESRSRRSWRDRVTRLDDEIDNCRAALEFTIAHDPVSALRLAVCLSPYFSCTHNDAESVRWISTALDRADSAAPPELRASAEYHLGTHRLFASDDLTGARDLFRRAAGALENAGDMAGAARAYERLARTVLALGEADSIAAAAARRALRCAKRADDDFATARALEARAMTLRVPHGLRFMEEAAQLFAALDAQDGLAQCLSNMAYAAVLVNDHRLAVELLERALPAAEEAADPTTLPHCLSNLALAHLIAGRLTAARACAVRWLEQLDQADRERADRKQEGYPVSETMDVLAALAACRGDLKHAARLSGVAIRLRPTGLAPRDADERLRREFLNPARQALTPQRWDRLEQEGTRLSIEQAIELAVDADQHSHYADPHSQTVVRTKDQEVPQAGAVGLRPHPQQ